LLRRAAAGTTTVIEQVVWQPFSRPEEGLEVHISSLITTAVDWWAMVTESYRATGDLVRLARSDRRAAAIALEAIRRLSRARLALAPCVNLD
jgi:hypothetical protein